MSTPVDLGLAAVCGAACAALATAAVLRLHTRSALITAYLALMAAALALRTAKLAVPGMSVYTPSGTDAPTPGSGDWWREVSQFAMAVAATAMVDCSVLVVLRLWHNALLVVWADAPWWPQHVLTVVVFLSISADIVATVCLGFLDPDLVNGADACKEAATMLLLSAGALWYAWQLRRCLTSLARMALGLSATSDVDHTLQRRVYGKLRVITAVSILMTAAAWLRAGLLLQFATQLVKGWSPSGVVNGVEQVLYYALTELLPGAVFASVLVKGALSRGCARVCGRRGGHPTELDITSSRSCRCCCGSGSDDDDGVGDGYDGGDGPRVGVGRLLAGTAGLSETPGSSSVQLPAPSHAGHGGWWMGGGWARVGQGGSSGGGSGGPRRPGKTTHKDERDGRHALLRTGGGDSAYTDDIGHGGGAGSVFDGYAAGGGDDGQHSAVVVGDFGYYGGGAAASGSVNGASTATAGASTARSKVLGTR